MSTSVTGRSAMAKLDKQEQRIVTIFGTQEVPEVDTETLEHYLDHLQQHLALPCQLTGSEDFDWEEYYVIGPGSKAEHERLRKTRPSYMDTYELRRLEEDVDLDEGILVHVRGVSDRPYGRERPIGGNHETAYAVSHFCTGTLPA